jgi:hypothetical protein
MSDKTKASSIAFLVLFVAGCGQQASAPVSGNGAWVEEQKARSTAQMDEYDKHTQRAQKILDRQDRMLDKWEEQQKRLDAILDAQEKQAGVKRQP